MVDGLETWSWLAAIVAVPVAMVGWFSTGKWNVNRSAASKGGIATSGDVRADRGGIVAGPNSSVSILSLSHSENWRSVDREKLHAVLQATRGFLDELAGDVLVSEETLRIIEGNAEDAPLFFNDELAAYLRKISYHARTVQTLTIALRVFQGQPKAEAACVLRKRRDWLLEQGGMLTERFRPALQLK